MLIESPEEWTLLILLETSSMHVFIDERLRLVVCRHLMPFSAFLIEPKPPLFAILIVILDLHTDDGSDGRKRVDHLSNECPVAKTNNAVRINRLD
jgi:hypothetical protein